MRRNGKRVLIQNLAACLIVLFTSVMVYGASLQEQFDQLCVHTQDAESLTIEKLQELVAECDQLLKAIEASSEPKKKLMIFRLKKCRNFLAYVIDLKQLDRSSGPQ